MSESSEATNVLAMQSAENQSNQSTEELQNHQAAYRLNGKNYLQWSQIVKTFLKGKGKLSYLLDKGPMQDDPKFPVWDEENSMIMSWLWNLL